MSNDVQITEGSGTYIETRQQSDTDTSQRQVIVASSDILRTTDSITPNSSAYAAANNLGGLRTISGFTRNSKGVIKRVLIKTNFAVVVPVYMHLFLDAPSETFTDKSAMPAFGTTTIGLLFKTIPFTSFEQRGTSQTLYHAEFEGVDIPYVTAGLNLNFAFEMGGATTFSTSKFFNTEVYTGDS